MRPLHSGPCVSFPADRYGSCVKCGKPMPKSVPLSAERPQSRNMGLDPDLDAALTLEAATAYGAAVAAPSLSAFAEARAGSGDIVVDGRDFDQEIAEELADAMHYSAWKARVHRPGWLCGDPDDTREYEHAMRTLGAVCRAWQESRTKTS